MLAGSASGELGFLRYLSFPSPSVCRQPAAGSYSASQPAAMGLPQSVHSGCAWLLLVPQSVFLKALGVVAFFPPTVVRAFISCNQESSSRPDAWGPPVRSPGAGKLAHRSALCTDAGVRCAVGAQSWTEKCKVQCSGYFPFFAAGALADAYTMSVWLLVPQTLRWVALPPSHRNGGKW